MNNSLTIIIALIGAITGIAGCILGIINTSRNIRKDAVRLRVETIYWDDRSWIMDGPPASPVWQPGINVVNFSDFQVTVNQVGYFTSKIKTILGFEDLPCAIPSRTNHCFKIDNISLKSEDRKKVSIVWVEIATGEIVRGKNTGWTKDIPK